MASASFIASTGGVSLAQPCSWSAPQDEVDDASADCAPTDGFLEVRLRRACAVAGPTDARCVAAAKSNTQRDFLAREEEPAARCFGDGHASPQRRMRPGVDLRREGYCFCPADALDRRLEQPRAAARDFGASSSAQRLKRLPQVGHVSGGCRTRRTFAERLQVAFDLVGDGVDGLVLWSFASPRARWFCQGRGKTCGGGVSSCLSCSVAVERH